MGSKIRRRTFLASTGIAGVAIGVGGPAAAASNGTLRVTGLRVSGVEQPLGLEDAKPLLSWRLEGAGRGLRQSAYRVTGASDPQRLQADQPDLWDSGKVESDCCFGVAYEGAKLASRQRVWWRVQAWDQRGAPCTPSAPSWWEMGLLQPTDWSAAWLAVEDAEGRADREAGLHWIWGETPAASTTRT